MMRMESPIFCPLVQRKEREKNQKENPVKNLKLNQKLNGNKSVLKKYNLKDKHIHNPSFLIPIWCLLGFICTSLLQCFIKFAVFIILRIVER